MNLLTKETCEEDLEQLRELLNSEDITITALKNADQELYKDLILKLMQQRTGNSESDF